MPQPQTNPLEFSDCRKSRKDRYRDGTKNADRYESESLRFQQSKETSHKRNLTELKRKHANFRRIIKENKKQSWRNYMSLINPQTPTSAVWKKIKCINGSKSSTKLQFLQSDDGRTVTQAYDIAKTLAK